MLLVRASPLNERFVVRSDSRGRISALYNVLFAFDAVLNESRHALFACLASSALLSARAVVEFAYKESACASADINWICIPGLIEIIAYQVFLISLGLGSVISQMGFRFYRIVGADLALREIYERYAQFVTLFRLNQVRSLVLLDLVVTLTGVPNSN